MQATIKWNQLRVYDQDGNEWGDLGALVSDAPANLDNVTIENGRIAEWPDFFIAAPGEQPEWDTPHVGVDWTGFEQALATRRGS